MMSGPVSEAKRCQRTELAVRLSVSRCSRSDQFAGWFDVMLLGGVSVIVGR